MTPSYTDAAPARNYWRVRRCPTTFMWWVESRAPHTCHWRAVHAFRSYTDAIRFADIRARFRFGFT